MFWFTWDRCDSRVFYIICDTRPTIGGAFNHNFSGLSRQLLSTFWPLHLRTMFRCFWFEFNFLKKILHLHNEWMGGRRCLVRYANLQHLPLRRGRWQHLSTCWRCCNAAACWKLISFKKIKLKFFFQKRAKMSRDLNQNVAAAKWKKTDPPNITGPRTTRGA